MAFSQPVNGFLFKAFSGLTVSNSIHRCQLLYFSGTPVCKPDSNCNNNDCAHEIYRNGMTVSQHHILCHRLQQHIAKWDACQESNCCSHNSQHQIFYKIKASYLKVRNSDGFHDTDFPVFFCHRKSNRKF